MSTDTSFAGAEKSAVNAIRTALGLGGVVALIVGILILIWPGHTAAFVTIILAIYALIAGLVYAGLGIFSKSLGGWARIGYIVLGVVFIAAAIVAFANPGPTTVFLAAIVAIFIGIAWVIEGVVSLSTLGDASSKGWTIFFAIISIVAGIIVVFSPLFFAEILWLLLGISLVVLGVIQIVRAFTFGKKV